MESRSTFRNKQTTVSWQYKIREKERQKWENAGKYKFWETIDLSLKKAIVKPVNRKIAEKIIKTYEWLGDMAVTNIYYGIFFDVFCGGVICINTNGSSAHGHIQFGVNRNEVSYFARGACAFWTPKGSASKLLSYALKLEKKRGAKVAIAYADNDAGEYGTVYQATNWLCIGKGEKKPQYFLGNRILDSRTWQELYKKDKSIKKRLEKEGWKKQMSSQKIRYCYILDNDAEIYEKILEKISDYPKRPTTL